MNDMTLGDAFSTIYKHQIDRINSGHGEEDRIHEDLMAAMDESEFADRRARDAMADPGSDPDRVQLLREDAIWAAQKVAKLKEQLQAAQAEFSGR